MCAVVLWVRSVGAACVSKALGTVHHLTLILVLIFVWYLVYVGHSWKVAEWNQCSVTCGGGTQVRRVECVSHDVSGRRLVEDSLCEAYTPRPVSQQTCSMQHCAQYSVSPWSQVNMCVLR